MDGCLRLGVVGIWCCAENPLVNALVVSRLPWLPLVAWKMPTRL